MSGVISVRVSKEEEKILKNAAQFYDCAISSLLKRFTFEKLEDEYDMRVIEEYEKEKLNGTLKTRPIDELWSELEI